MTFLLIFVMTSQFLLTRFFCSSEISKQFKAKPQIKNIQSLKHIYTGKNKYKVRNKDNAQFFTIMMLLFLAWHHNMIIFSLKYSFRNLSGKLLLQYILVLTLNQGNPQSDKPSLTNVDVTLSSILIESVVL